MNAAEKTLVAALRSRKYKQGTRALRPSNSTFCCLGVACDVLGTTNWVLTPGIGYTYSGEGVVLPKSIQDKLRWRYASGTLAGSYNAPRSLALLNDEGLSFSEIADLIAAGKVAKKIKRKVKVNRRAPGREALKKKKVVIKKEK